MQCMHAYGGHVCAYMHICRRMSECTSGRIGEVITRGDIPREGGRVETKRNIE